MRILNYKLIETLDELAGIIQELEKQGALAVDLEADSMFHYKEKVCLVQMATGSHNYVLDPLKIKDLSLLKPIFRNPEIQKIFHGADYDVRSLHRDFQIDIQNMFDTQLASRFLGDKSTGLEAVVHKRFNVQLNKKYQKKDWSERPLPEKMVEYAARDTFYLLPLTEMLKKELGDKGRLEWVFEECELLSRVRAIQPNGEPLFLRFKGAGRLNRKQLGILESILQYRAKIAEEKDRPLFKVYSNISAMKLALSPPGTMHELRKSKVLSPKQVNMFGAGLVKVIREALSAPLNKLPSYPHKKQPSIDPNIPKRLKALKTWRDSYAGKLKIDSSIITPKNVLTTLAVKKPKNLDELEQIEDMKNWRKREFGKKIIDVLNQCD